MPCNTDLAELRFRPATTADYPSICGLINDEEELFLVHPRGHFPLTVAQLEELARHRRGFTVGEQGGRVMAFANLYDFAREHAFIGNLVVAVAARGQGAGRRLVEHMLTLAREEYGLSETRISVFGDNTPALLLYASVGFAPFDMEARMDPGGRRRALLHMRKRLTDTASR